MKIFPFSPSNNAISQIQTKKYIKENYLEFLHPNYYTFSKMLIYFLYVFVIHTRVLEKLDRGELQRIPANV